MALGRAETSRKQTTHPQKYSALFRTPTKAKKSCSRPNEHVGVQLGLHGARLAPEQALRHRLQANVLASAKPSSLFSGFGEMQGRRSIHLAAARRLLRSFIGAAPVSTQTQNPMLPSVGPAHTHESPH